jgi:hypothetical protein
MIVFPLPLCYRLSVSPLSPTCLLLTVSEARSYFVSTIDHRRFRDVYCLHQGGRPDDVGSTHLETSVYFKETVSENIVIFNCTEILFSVNVISSPGYWFYSLELPPL